MKRIVKHIVPFLILIAGTSAHAQDVPDVLSFVDDQHIHLRWKGVANANLEAYKVYREVNGSWDLLSTTERLVKNSEIREMVGSKTELYLKLAGASSASSDFDDALFRGLVANTEAYQFFGAMTVMNAKMAQAFGEYVALQRSLFSETEINIKITAIVNGNEQDVGTIKVNNRVETMMIPEELNAEAGKETVQINWTKGTEVDIRNVGQYIYRSANLLGPYERMNSMGITFSNLGEEDLENTYVDDYVDPGTYYYYVSNYNVFGLESEPSAIIEVLVGDLGSLESVENLTASSPVKKLKLNWSPTSNEQNFLIYRSDDNGRTFNLLYPPSERMEFQKNEYVDRTAEEGVLYHYYVSTTNGSKTLYSDTIRYQLADETPPSAPVGVKGTASKSGLVTITWTANKEADILGYEIERYTGDSGTNNFLLTGKPIAIARFSENIGAQTENAFRYVVFAIDQSYNRSTGSQPIRLRRPDDIPPKTPVVNHISIEDSVVTLRWTPNFEDDFDHYNVYSKPEAGRWEKIAQSKQNELLDTVPVNGDHSYTISAVDQDKNESKRSEDYTVVYRSEFTLASPTNGSAMDSSGGIYLKWDASTSSGTVGYTIERQEEGSEMVQLVKVTKNEGTEYLDTHVSSRKKYTYFITAYDKNWYVSRALEIGYGGLK